MGLSALLSSQILDASATGRSVITGADASAIRTTLGLGTLATQSPTGTPSASTFLRGDFSWQTIDLSGYVPYSGATGAVNLGSNSLTASKLIVDQGTSGAASTSIRNQTFPEFGLSFHNNNKFSLSRSSTTLWETGQTGPEGYFTLGGTACLAFSSSSTFANLGSGDLQLHRDSSNTLAQRRTTNAQTFRVYNTFTDASNYERGQLAWESNEWRIGSAAAGTGTQRNLVLGSWNSSGSWSPGLTLTPAGTATIATSLRIANGNISYENTRIWTSNAFQIVSVNGSNWDTELHAGYWNPTLLKYVGTLRSLKTFAFSCGEEFVWLAGNAGSGSYTGSNHIARLEQTGNFSLNQTWNNAATTFTGILSNVTDTASNANSLLMDLQVGGTSCFSIKKSGLLQHNFAGAAFPGGIFTGGSLGGGIASSTCSVGNNSGHIAVNSTGLYAFTTTANASTGTYDLILVRDAAQTLAQRNGTSPQVHRIYNTFTDASNYERAKIAWESNVLVIGTEQAGTGSARNLRLLQSGGTFNNAIEFYVNSTLSGLFRSNNFINLTGSFIGNAAGNAVNVTYGWGGAVSDTSNLRVTLAAGDAWSFASVNVNGGDAQVIGGSGKPTGNSNGGHVYLDGGQGYGTGVHGSIIIGATRARLLAFGGITSSFPAIKRNAAALNFRLADDSADCDITAKAATFSGNVTVTQGQIFHSNGNFAASGDAQHIVLVARRNTTDATANQVLFLDGNSQRLVIPPSTVWVFSIKLTAYNITNNECAWWIFRGAIRRNAANDTRLPNNTLISENDSEGSLSTATATVVADDINEALEIRVTGVASKNIRWVAVIDIAQTSG